MTALAATAAALAVAIAFGGHRESKHAPRPQEAVPGQPAVHIVSPRNGARQSNHAVVVKVDITDFELAPRRFGGEPQLGRGNIRFSLHRVPNCVLPAKLERAINSPIGNGRLVGKSFDYPRYSGPNGRLAERIGSSGSYSPATRPEILYHGLWPGFYRLVVGLAQNNGAVTRYHAVTNFQILTRPGHHTKPCPPGRVSSAQAAERF